MVVGNSAWRTKKERKTKTHPNTKSPPPIFNSRNKNLSVTLSKENNYLVTFLAADVSVLPITVKLFKQDL